MPVSVAHRRPGSLTIADPALFATGCEAEAALFCRRIFAEPAVQAITIDPVRASATIRWGLSAADHAILAALAKMARSGEPVAASVLPPWQFGAIITLRRYGAVVSTCEILRLAPGRLRLRHPVFGLDPKKASELIATLRREPTVRDVRVSHSLATLDLRSEPAAGCDLLALLRRIERLLAGPPPAPATMGVEPTSFAIPNLAVAVAATGELVTPAAVPVAAGLLIFGNLQTLRAAGEQIMDGRAGLPALYGTIVAATLISGGYLSAAMMFWFFRFWEQSHRLALAGARKNLIAAVQRPATRAVAPGSRIRVAAGEVVPADGTVASGIALVEPGLPGGQPRPIRVRAGAKAAAGTLVRAGRIDIEVERSGGETLGAELARSVLAGNLPAPSLWTLTADAERFAAGTVMPSYIAAAFGLAIGGAGMANAVLRPDYATGIGLAAPLRSLAVFHRGLRYGAAVLRPDNLALLARARWAVIDDHPELTEPPLELVELTASGESEDRLLPAIAAAGAWLGDDRSAALLRACGRRRLIARQAPLTRLGDGSVTVAIAGRMLHLRDGPDQASSLLVERDGIEIAQLRFARLGPLPGAEVIRALRRAGVRVAVLTQLSEAASAARARQLGADAEASGLDGAERARLIDELQRRSGPVLHLADGPALPTAETGIVTVALSDAHGPRLASDIALLGRSAAPVTHLLALARGHLNESGRDRQIIVGTNVLAVAAVLTLGLSGMAVVLVSNLATWAVHTRARQAFAKARSGRPVAGLVAAIATPQESASAVPAEQAEYRGAA